MKCGYWRRADGGRFLYLLSPLLRLLTHTWTPFEWHFVSIVISSLARLGKSWGQSVWIEFYGNYEWWKARV